jgi:hypothetical protein
VTVVKLLASWFSAAIVLTLARESEEAGDGCYRSFLGLEQWLLPDWRRDRLVVPSKVGRNCWRFS